MKCNMFGIIFILSLLFYVFAPNTYSFDFCIFNLIVFLVDAFLLIRRDRFEKVGFNFLFTLSFLMVTYVYPIFVFPILPDFSLFAYKIDTNVISKATGLSTFAYASYAYGYYYQLKKLKLIKNQISCVSLFDQDKLQLIAFGEFILFIVFIICGGMQMFGEMYSQNTNAINPVASFAWLIFYNFTIFVAIANIDFQNKVISILLIIILIILFFTGTRTLPLLLFSMFFCRWWQTHKVDYKRITTLLIIGALIFVWIGNIRGNESQHDSVSSEELGVVSNAVDFIVNTRNLYDIYSHVETEGITYGTTSLAYIINVIPFAQQIISRTFNIPSYRMRSETLTTYWNLGEDSSLGLGTHIVGDVYISFGLVGIIILFFFLGRFVVYSRNGAYNGDPKYFVTYLVLISGAIFMCRGSFFYSFKNIIWTILLYLFFKNIKNCRLNKIKQISI